jgi:hypothetical protein
MSIDQSNTAERNHQVGLMNFIFSSADNVIAWLGTSNPPLDDTCRLLDEFRELETQNPVGSLTIFGCS